MKTWYPRGRVTYAMALLVGACTAGTGTTDERIGIDESAIINGTTVWSNDLRVVRLETNIEGSTAWCTGTLLTNRWVLTARHCVAGNADTEVRLDGVALRSRTVLPHRDLDVALVALEDGFLIGGTRDGYRRDFYSGSNASLVGVGVTCQGFGRNTYTGGFGTLRTAELNVSAATAGTITLVPNASGQIPWRGDSGGSCFRLNAAGTSLDIVGVNSTCQVNPTSQTVRFCTEVGAEAVRDWANSILRDEYTTVRDTDGNGTSDLLFWSRQSGDVTFGENDSAASLSWDHAGNFWNWIPSAADAWKFEGDFNGDGKEDTGFWYGGDGNIWLGVSDGTSLSWSVTGTSWGWIVTDPSTWRFTGDFNNDGKTDVGFWFGGDGNIWLGLSDGASIRWTLGGNAWPFIPADASTWRFTGDFNGDGKTDLGFWFGGDGNIWLGLSDGASIHWTLGGNAWSFIPTDGSTWRFTGDFNGDGKTDLGFWFGGDGNIWLGLSNGTGIAWTLGGTAWPFIPTDGSTWRFTGDFNGDGKTDLGFWFGGDGNIWLGLSNGTGLGWKLGGNAWPFIPTDGNASRFTGDFNGDGKTDLGFWYRGDGHIWQGLSAGETIGFKLAGRR